jgi:hypothetical protein
MASTPTAKAQRNKGLAKKGIKNKGGSLRFLCHFAPSRWIFELFTSSQAKMLTLLPTLPPEPDGLTAAGCGRA